MTEKVALEEGELPLQKKVVLAPPPQVVVHVHDIEHNISLVGVREPGQHSYRYCPEDDPPSEG